ncbi:MAG: ankyrin repeat domain-containing protein [Myxococcota bacterium]
MPVPFALMLFLLASLLGPRLVVGDERDALPMLLEDEPEASGGAAVPGVVSEERVVWIEGFGWMGSADLFEGLGVQVDAPGFGEVPGSEESLGVLEAVLSLLAESPDAPEVPPAGEMLPPREEELPGGGAREVPLAPEDSDRISAEEAQARFVAGLEKLAEQGSAWLRVRAEVDGAPEPLVGVEWEEDLLWAEAVVQAGDVQGHDERFVTPLHEAAAAGAFRAALLLLDRGADVEAADARRWLPIHYAARHGHGVQVALFLAYGSPMAGPGRDERSPLQLAARHGHEQAVAALLAGAAPLDARGAAQPTALHLAVLGGHTGVVRQLLAAGADASSRAGRGVTPLHLAALQADPEILAALLEAGASPETENHDGRTPLDVAARNGHEAAFPAPADME